MTVIAWDGKIIAADKQASRGGTLRRTTKLLAFKWGSIDLSVQPFILGFSGTEQTGLIVADWYADGAKEEDFPKCQTDGTKESEYWSSLVVVDSGGLKLYTLWPKALVIQESYFAIGSGEDFALGAMAAGADAIEAVEIAIGNCESCGMGVDAYDLKTMEKIR